MCNNSEPKGIFEEIAFKFDKIGNVGWECGGRGKCFGQIKLKSDGYEFEFEFSRLIVKWFHR